jgi:hypothetical protein
VSYYAVVARLSELVASHYTVGARLSEPVAYLEGPVVSVCDAVAPS